MIVKVEEKKNNPETSEEAKESKELKKDKLCKLNEELDKAKADRDY